MTKKLLILSATVLAIGMQPGHARAVNPDTGPGCGLGKIAWADFKHQKNIAPQVLMATTNGTGMNTLAISSGTSGCTNDGQVWASEKANVFAAVNFDNLEQEIAQRGGEHLASLATLLDVPADKHAAFFAMTQERYLSLVQAGETSSVALVRSLNDAIAKHPVLAQASAR